MKRFSLLFAALLVTPFLYAEEGWLTSIEKAQEIAKKEGKDILVDFTGSDWCGWCIRLKKEVFSTPKFKSEAPKKFVLVVLDFPMRKKISKEQKAYNRKMAKKFGIRGYPTIILLDAQGRPFGRTGYRPGGPVSYLKHLDDFVAKRKERDAALAKAKSATSKEEQIRAYIQAAKAMLSVIGHYEDIVEKVFALDPQVKLDEAGELAYYLREYYQRRDRNKSKKYEALAKKNEKVGKAIALEEELEKSLKSVGKDINKAKTVVEEFLKKPNLPRFFKQQLVWIQAMITYRLERKREPSEKVLGLIEKAGKLAPETRLGKQCENILKRFRKK
ncbi:MAG: DUF255 domain-containing protein [Planctomycetota bacterium]|nr:MAG: DUF255 domain-containing protein [Planctomycetota bacterium]